MSAFANFFSRNRVEAKPMTTAPTHIPFNELHIDPVNMRKSKREPDAEFMATVLAKGIIEPLIVRKNDKGWGIIAGGRRYVNVEALIKEKKLPKDYLMPVSVRAESDKEARETSLIENIERLPAHPADCYEAFAELKKAGMKNEDIARRFGIKAKRVEQLLALGALSPKILQAYRDDKIKSHEAEYFTLEKDHKRQDAIFDRLNKNRSLHSYAIKQAIRGAQDQLLPLYKLIGKEAYEKAGGTFTQNLFEDRDEPKIDRLDIVEKLGREQIETQCKKLTDAGWKWASYEGDIQQHAVHYWERVGKYGQSKFTAAEKAKSGCILTIENGKLKISYGRLKPGTAKPIEKNEKPAKTKAAKKAPAKPSFAISQSLDSDLKDSLIAATRKALLVIAGEGGLEGAMAKTLASMIYPDRTSHIPQPLHKQMPALREVMENDLIVKEIHAAFDREDYFSRAGKGPCLKALEECIGKDEARKAAGKKKGELAKYAQQNVDKTWLPPQLRTPHYKFKAKG